MQVFGCNARYVNAQLSIPNEVDVDFDVLVRTSSSDPITPVYKAGGNVAPTYGSNTNRCVGTVDIRTDATVSLADAFKINFPYSFTLPSVGQNHASAIVMPDGHTFRQINALARCTAGGPVYGLNTSFATCSESLRGEGITCYGGHGGTGLSSIGGTLTASDVQDDQPIRHALKINLRPWQYYIRDRVNGPCEWRWPAKKCDNTAYKYTDSRGFQDVPSSYVVANKEGALLALPPNLTPESLGIRSRAGRKMFDVLQDYGVYTVDESGIGSSVRNSFSGTYEFKDAFRSYYGHQFTIWDPNDTSDWANDMKKIISNLHVVDDNTSSTIGGSGTSRRRPYAPALDGTTPPPTTPSTCTNTLTSSVSIPTGYGASYNPLTSAREYLVSVACTNATRATITAGNGNPLTYVYNRGYYYSGTAWTPYTLTCASGALISGAWCPGRATASIPLPQNPTNVIAYTCQYTNSTWKCGCRDATCSTAYWQLQRVGR